MKQIEINHTMSSREIAAMTGKSHADILKAIRKMESAWEKVNGGKFSLVDYIDTKGEKRPEYQLLKKECLYIATKFNDEARAKLIIRWEELEKQSAKPSLESITKKDLAIMLLESEQEKEALLLENQRMKPRDEYIDKVFSSDGLLTMSEASKSLGLDIGRNILYNILRDKGILFKGSKEPKQEFVNRGYFALKQTMIQIKKGDSTITKVEPQTMVTQKGLGYIAKILGIVNTAAQ
ncbi:phage antirepressor KilAC domain-containing protein [Myroides odoratus]|uniref:phage antirepressor KilAC domain-containing protein n=1 Tax=Myroides odoratus TaxID=256 RepID=UPI0009E6D28C|nr:phage regulatory protein/antirepressor Ant [Myroides odoratus]